MTRPLDLTVEEVQQAIMLLALEGLRAGDKGYSKRLAEVLNALIESKRQAFALLQPKREREHEQGVGG